MAANPNYPSDPQSSSGAPFAHAAFPHPAYLRLVPLAPDVQQTQPAEVQPTLPEEDRGDVALYDLFDNAPASARVLPDITILTSKMRHLGRRVKAAAKRIQTRVFLGREFITAADLDNNGDYTDEYDNRSDAFVVMNGAKIAAARQINCERSGLMSLPTAKHFDVNPLLLAQVAGVESLVDLRRSEVVEISGLAAEAIPNRADKGGPFDAVIALYAKMLAHSLEEGHKVWVMNVEPFFVRMLGSMLGRDNVHILGKLHAYMGPATQAVAINPQQAIRSILTNPKRPEYVEYMKACLRGIDDKHVPEDIRALLSEQDIQVHHEGAFERAARGMASPDFVIGMAAVAASAGYSFLRASAGSELDAFTGDPNMLKMIDVSTSIPYGFAFSKIFTARTLGGKLAATAVAAPTFLAPYAYYYANSKREGYPWYVNAIVGAMLGSVALQGAFRHFSRLNREAVLFNELPKPRPEEVIAV